MRQLLMATALAAFVGWNPAAEASESSSFGGPQSAYYAGPALHSPPAYGAVYYASSAPYLVTPGKNMGWSRFTDYTDPAGDEDLQTFDYAFQEYGIDRNGDGFYEPPADQTSRVSILYGSSSGRW